MTTEQEAEDDLSPVSPEELSEKPVKPLEDQTQPCKTQCILFTKNQHLQPNSNLSLHNQHIPLCKEETFLGSKQQTQPPQSPLRKAWRITLNNNQNLPILYPPPVRILPAWITLTNNQPQRLQVIQNKALKLAHPPYISNHYIHSITGIQTIKQQHQVIAQRYLKTAINNPASLTSSSIQSPAPPTSCHSPSPTYSGRELRSELKQST
ncbi:hypothetical protein INR49_002742 [Caranx melampygus]|nr:hypothetical protein INR49_002742 [Caranx melampygus]